MFLTGPPRLLQTPRGRYQTAQSSLPDNGGATRTPPHFSAIVHGSLGGASRLSVAFPTARISTFPQLYKGNPRHTEARLGYRVSVPAGSAPVGVGKSTLERPSFRPEMAPRRLLPEGQGRRSYHIPKPCQASREATLPRLSPTTAGDHQRRPQPCRPVR